MTRNDPSCLCYSTRNYPSCLSSCSTRIWLSCLLCLASVTGFAVVTVLVLWMFKLDSDLVCRGTGRPAPSAGSVFYFLFELAKGAISTLAEVSPQELVICEELLASFESVGVFTKNSEMRFCPRVLSGDIPARKTRGEGSEMGGR